MQIDDLRRLESGQQIDTDLCIVGSGPAGLSIAGEFIGTSVRTLVLESGGLAEGAEVDGLSEIESVGAPRIMDQRLVRNRMFGGTSHSWTGRCAPFDAIDFAARPWVPYSGWPIAGRNLAPFVDRACPYLGLQPVVYDELLWGEAGHVAKAPASQNEPLRTCFWQFSSDPARRLDHMRLGPAFLQKAAPNIRVLLHATACDIETNAAATRVVALRVATPEGKQATVRTRAVVLCAGGIDNARLLLCARRVAPAGLGNQHDLVGRFLMDHPRCTLAELDPHLSGAARERYGHFRLGSRRRRNSFAAGIALSAECQKNRELLNCAAWLTEDRAADDPWDAAKRLISGQQRRRLQDAWSCLSQPQIIASGVRNRLRGRGISHKVRRLVLDCIVEQVPDPDSRIVLSDRRDRLGMPIARLDWRISAREKATVAALGRLICERFAQDGWAVPRLADWVRASRPDEATFTDVCHPTGTTRMSADPAFGVVDANCQVHGVAGLFVAGSSVFPTSGHANPTLMIVALAIRLADWLKGSGSPLQAGARECGVEVRKKALLF